MKTICDIKIDDLGLKWNLFLAKSGDSIFKEQSISPYLFQMKIISDQNKQKKKTKTQHNQKLILILKFENKESEKSY